MLEHQDCQQGDESSEWWPEYLAPIGVEFKALLAREYVPCALVVQPRDLSRVTASYVDIEIIKDCRAVKGDELVRLWDRVIREAQEEGHRVLAVVFIGFEGGIKALSYADYSELILWGIGPDLLEQGVADAVARVRRELGVSYWPLMERSEGSPWLV